MKNFKIAAAAVLLACAVLLTGCSDSKIGSINDLVNSGSSSDAALSSDEGLSGDTDVTAASSDAETSQDSTDTSAASSSTDTPDSSTFIHSVVDLSAGKFVCEMLGIGADLPSDASYYSDAELAYQNGISDTSDADFEKALNTNGIVYDALVYLDSYGTNFNLVYEDMNYSGIAYMSEENYIDANVASLQSQLDDSESTYYKSAEKTVAHIAGQDKYCVYITSDYDGSVIHQAVIAFKKGDYMACLTITAWSEESLDEIVDIFYAL